LNEGRDDAGGVSGMQKTNSAAAAAAIPVVQAVALPPGLAELDLGQEAGRVHDEMSRREFSVYSEGGRATLVYKGLA
jgi:hypothetical protein